MKAATVLTNRSTHLPVIQDARPRVRGECALVTRPCPHLGCSYHLGPEAAATGTSCTLDVADEGEHTLEEIGQVFGVSRERVRQIEQSALQKLARRWREEPDMRPGRGVERGTSASEDDFEHGDMTEARGRIRERLGSLPGWSFGYRRTSEAMRALWDKRGTLWGSREMRRLRRRIRLDLVKEFGPRRRPTLREVLDR